MECEKCKTMIVLSAFSNGNCYICDKKITTSHIPCDKLCEECSDEQMRCKVCCKEIEK